MNENSVPQGKPLTTEQVREFLAAQRRSAMARGESTYPKRDIEKRRWLGIPEPGEKR